MSVASRVADGWVQRAVTYLNFGKSVSDFYLSLFPLLPGEGWQTASALWTRGQQAQAAGEAAGAPGASGTVPAGQIPGQAPGVYGYCYGILAQWVDDSTGQTQEIYTSYTAGYQLSAGQLENQAGSISPAQYSASMGGRRYGKEDSRWRFTGFQILSLVRC